MTCDVRLCLSRCLREPCVCMCVARCCGAPRWMLARDVERCLRCVLVQTREQKMQTREDAEKRAEERGEHAERRRGGGRHQSAEVKPFHATSSVQCPCSDPVSQRGSASGQLSGAWEACGAAVRGQGKAVEPQ